MTTTTKKPQFSLTAHILLDAILLLSFIGWQIEGLAGAGNVFLFLTWGLAGTGILAALLGKSKDFAPTGPKHPFLYRAYKKVRSAALIVATAWLGMFWLAGTYLVAVVLVTASGMMAAKEGGAA